MTEPVFVLGPFRLELPSQVSHGPERARSFVLLRPQDLHRSSRQLDTAVHYIIRDFRASSQSLTS